MLCVMRVLVIMIYRCVITFNLKVKGHCGVAVMTYEPDESVAGSRLPWYKLKCKSNGRWNNNHKTHISNWKKRKTV